MYICDRCGRQVSKKIRYWGYTLCSKHMHQLNKYGRFLDGNPRSTNDLNHYEIKDDIAIFDLYDQKSNKIAEFIIDLEDLDLVRYHRWRMSYGRVVTGNNTNTNPTRYLTHILLDVDSTDYYHKIDHIDGNPLNNRKRNLRICTQGENVCNKVSVSNNTSGIIGVYQDHRKGRKFNWCAEIRRNHRRYHIGAYKSIEEAAYARYIAEETLFGEYRNTNNDEIKMQMFETIPHNRKRDIANYVTSKIAS